MFEQQSRILDNHVSHLCITGLDYCKVNGIVVLSLPPHCSHKLQPLDRTVFGPFKKSVNGQCDAWISSNPGKAMTIYDIPGIVKSSWPASATNANILSGFHCTGIWPLNPDIFQDHEYMPSIVTDRDAPVVDAGDAPIVDTGDAPTVDARDQLDRSLLNDSAFVVGANEVVEGPRTSTPISFGNEDASISALMDNSTIESISTASTNESTASMQSLDETIEEIRPLPKAAPRNESRRQRKTRKSEILTDSPVMEELRATQKAAKAKKQPKSNQPKTVSKKVEKPAASSKKTSKKLTSKKTDEPQPSTSTGKRAKQPQPSTSTGKRAKQPQPSTSTGKKGKRYQTDTSDDDSEEDLQNLCCVCLEGIAKLSTNKICTSCHGEAHNNCVRTDGPLFTCKNCFSDIDDDEEEQVEEGEESSD